MPAYRYRAVGGDKMVHGVTEGKNEAAIVADLQKRGLMVLGIAPAAGAAAPLDIRIGGGGLRRGELTEVTRELASMLGAGQDLDRALRLVVEGGGEPADRDGAGAGAGNVAGWCSARHRAGPRAAKFS